MRIPRTWQKKKRASTGSHLARKVLTTANDVKAMMRRDPCHVWEL
jgi:hypothetical protein